MLKFDKKKYAWRYLILESYIDHCALRLNSSMYWITTKSWNIIGSGFLQSLRISIWLILKFEAIINVLKILLNSFFSNFWATPWSNNSSFNQSDYGWQTAGNLFFILFVLKACILLTQAFKTMNECAPTSKQREK